MYKNFVSGDETNGDLLDVKFNPTKSALTAFGEDFKKKLRICNLVMVISVGLIVSWYVFYFQQSIKN